MRRSPSLSLGEHSRTGAISVQEPGSSLPPHWLDFFYVLGEKETLLTDSMTHRKIRDEDGRWWDVWEVYPSAVERRMSGEYPSVTGHGDPAIDGRTDGGRRREVRLRVPEELQQGWLAFQAGSYRRRLVPVPENWSTLDDEALAGLLERADRVDGDGR